MNNVTKAVNVAKQMRILTLFLLIVWGCKICEADTQVVNGITWHYEVINGHVCLGVSHWADDGDSSWKELDERAVDCDTSGYIVIPTTIRGYPVTGIGYGAFSGCDKLSEVKIPESVVWIGESAFERCAGLEEMTVPSSVNEISDYAFSDCSSLKRLIINEGVTSICLGAFQRCGKLKEIVIPRTVTDISSIAGYNMYPGAFQWCDSIESVTVPGNFVLSRIFARPDVIRRVSITSGSDSVCSEFAKGLSQITNVTIATSVTSIGRDAFMGCTCLGSGIVTSDNGACMFSVSDSSAATIEIGPTVVCVADDVWEHCQNLATITVEEGNVKYQIIDGVLYSADGKTLVASPKNLTKIVVPDGVTIISESAFWGCAGLEDVVIPSSVIRIGANAFKGCMGIRTINIPASYNVATVFPDAYSLITEMTIPEGTTSIAANAYQGCAALTAVALPSSVTDVGLDAFAGCGGLTRVDISDLAAWYGIGFGNAAANPLCYAKHLFLNGSEITSLDVPAGLAEIRPYAFYNAALLTTVTIPSTMTSIGTDAFGGCTGIRSVELPASYTLSAVFPDAYSAIAEMTIPEGTTSIAANAYQGCSALTAVAIPSTVKSIGASAFAGCGGLTRVDISDLAAWYGIAFGNAAANPLYYAKHLFLNGSEITSLDVPAGLAEIRPYTFYNAASLTTVSIPSAVTSIGTDAFGGCTGIRTATIPSRFVLSSVFPAAYDKLTSLTLLGGEPTVVANACSGCASLTSVEIPADVKTLGGNAFKDCSNLTSVTFLGEAPACGDNVFAGTSPNLVVHAAPNSSGWMQWNGRPIAFDAQSGGSGTPAAEVTRAELTITNVMVCYIMNSVQPDRVIPASMDAGYVNILTEVKSGGVVSVPATWMVNYPNYVAKFGADFTQSLMKPTGKRDGMGNPMTVWQDYVAGTDPTDEDDVFTASITTDANGKLIISYTPELSEAEKAKRVYKTLGKVKLQDKDWVEVPAGSEGDYNFFKVTVEMK